MFDVQSFFGVFILMLTPMIGGFISLWCAGHHFRKEWVGYTFIGIGLLIVIFGFIRLFFMLD